MILVGAAKVLMSKVKGGVTATVKLDENSSYTRTVFKHDEVFYTVEFVIERDAVSPNPDTKASGKKSVLCLTNFERTRFRNMAASTLSERDVGNLMALTFGADMFLTLDGALDDASEEAFVNQPG